MSEWDTGTTGDGGWGAATNGDSWGASGKASGGDAWGTSGGAANKFSGDNSFDAVKSNGFDGGMNGSGANGGRVNDGACFNCGEQG